MNLLCFALIASCFFLGCDAPSVDGMDLDGGGDSTAHDAAHPDGAHPDVSAPDTGSSDLGVPDGGGDATRDAAFDAEVFDAGPPLRCSEFVSKNDGVYVDEVGETDDLIELENVGSVPIELSNYEISDDEAAPHRLPEWVLAAGERVVLWADDDPAQGALHLPFKLSSSGETVWLWGPEGVVERVTLPALEVNQSFQRYPEGWRLCGWATPGRQNGAYCGPPPPPALPEVVEFESYVWAEPWPFPPAPLVMAEIDLRAGGFVEVLNSGEAPIQLSAFSLRLAPHAPGAVWPDVDTGVALPWPTPGGALPSGERVVVNLPEGAAIESGFEGVLTLWGEGRRFPVDRVDFMAWPEDGVLTRQPDATGRHRFCTEATPGEANDTCAPMASRSHGARLRHLRTPGDAGALAAGGLATGIESIKFVIDLEGGDAVHLLDAEDWDLHYTFIREVIEGADHLDRCDPEENAVFRQGWQAFSQDNYYRVEGRRYLLGTLVHHTGANLYTVEFASGDQISSAQMRRAFFAVMGHVDHPQAFSLRPQTGAHIERALELDGQLPIVDTNAPFRGVTFQALTQTVGYGVLTFVAADALGTAALGPQVLVVTDQVPNDIPLVGGLVTEAFQTPLAHVNLLSRNRDTPNMALLGARDDPRLTPFFGELVRLEVSGAGFDVRVASGEEAADFWAARQPDGPALTPRLDLTVRGVVPLDGRGLEDLPALGAKAAQLAELSRVVSERAGCPGLIQTPDAPMAIPVVHSLEHFVASGAAAHLEALVADADFESDPRVRSRGLAEVRALVLAHRVDPALLSEVEAYLSAHFGEARVRFRSSSNTEDLPGFSGAGLYTSISAALGDPSRRVEDAIRVVWASLWTPRAYDERAFLNVGAGVAMGVLVHPAFLSERANGVGISRNVLDPIRSSYYFNVQRGEASVTNPAPGVSTDQFLYDFTRRPTIRYVGASSLVEHGQTVFLETETDAVACVLRVIHEHFQPLLDPEQVNRWFAMDIEFKLLGDERRLLVKQARPYSFGATSVPSDCREL